MIAVPGNRDGGKSEHRKAKCRVEDAGVGDENRRRRKVSQKINRPGCLYEAGVRMKRRGKSPPPGAQVPGH